MVPYKVPGSIATVSYNFHGTCEHVLTAPCNTDLYEVVGDFLQSDLSLGRVGLRLPDYYAIIDEDLRIIEEGNKPDNVRLSETENQTSVSIFDESNLIVSVIHTVDQIVITSAVDGGELCGLCGSINGSLISSDGARAKDVANKLEIDVFASSWLVEPSEQILREYRIECGKFDMATDKIVCSTCTSTVYCNLNYLRSLRPAKNVKIIKSLDNRGNLLLHTYMQGR